MSLGTPFVESMPWLKLGLQLQRPSLRESRLHARRQMQRRCHEHDPCDGSVIRKHL
jgi:hypothetical protein